MGHKELQDALEDLGFYLVARLPDGWDDARLEIEFLDVDVVGARGEYRTKSGETAPVALDYRIVDLAGEFKDALVQLHGDEIRGLHVSLGADGALSAKLSYPAGT